MKQLLTSFSPPFNPTAKTLDFTMYPYGFNINKLYAVINVTQGVPIYIAGAPGLGFSSLGNGLGGTSYSVITLQFNTSTHNSSDLLNIYYDVAPGVESNTPQENNGQLQLMQESMNQVLVELKTMNFILAQGLNINIDDIQSIRNDVNNPQNILI